MSTTIRRAESEEAWRLSAIALAAKRHWGYPEEWMELWKDEFVITPEYVSREHGSSLIPMHTDSIPRWVHTASEALPPK